MQIENMVGEKIIAKTIVNEPLSAIDVSKLQNGIYLIKIQDEKETIVKKFVKQWINVRNLSLRFLFLFRK
ncbi:MAG: T9SS type A sorting domain-containing protein [Bacteroidia bacterium]